ncbi:putative ABC transporter permease protein YtcP [Clostridia bacterium]|nr:putative ABC transporter permease protein YtcP [Clostridia bacterium]
MKKNAGDFALDTVIYLVLTLMALSTLLPFANVLAKSVSADWAVVTGKVGILPVGFQIDTMAHVVRSSMFLGAFGVSALITLTGTALAIVLTALTAYPLSKPELPGRKPFMLVFVFTMLFSGGLIPGYLLIKNLGLMNNLFALILPGMLSVYNMLIIKNYYESLPESLEESARLDGASALTILFRIILPLSTPVLATISLFYAVGFWNDYIGPMLYITKASLKPLQLYLRDLVMMAANPNTQLSADQMMNLPAEGVRAATIIASTIPIVLVYPYLQKYFIKGILIGSVKG